MASLRPKKPYIYVYTYLLNSTPYCRLAYHLRRELSNVNISETNKQTLEHVMKHLNRKCTDIYIFCYSTDFDWLTLALSTIINSNR